MAFGPLDQGIEGGMADYTLPDLDYDYGALEPHISVQINEIHHSKHHATYVKGVNDAVAKLRNSKTRAQTATIRRSC
jgi:Fe-Mn family superoxide dismutase